MRKIVFSLFFTIFSFASDIVFDPYGDLNTTADDMNFDSYLNYVTDTLIRKQEVRDRLQELQKPTDTIVIDNIIGTVTKTIYDLQSIPTTTIQNIVPIGSVGSEYDSYNTKLNLPTLGGAAWELLSGDSSYEPWYSSSVYTDGRTYNYTNPLYSIYREVLSTKQRLVETNEHFTASNIIADKSLLLQNQQFKLQSDSLNEGFKQTNALNEIKAQIQTNNILTASGNSKLDSIATMTDYIAINTNAGAYNSAQTNLKLDATNGLLTDIKDTLNLGGDFTGFDTSGINASSDSILAEGSNFIDSFQDNFTSIVDNATSIKTDFDNIKSIISGNDIAPFSMVSSSGACDISFNFFGSSITPLSSLPNILSRYSAVFSLLTYISIMFLNFRFLFLFFAVGRK